MKLFSIITLIFMSLNAFPQLPAFKSDKIGYHLKFDTTMVGVSKTRIEHYEVKEDSVFLRPFWEIEEHIYSNGKIDSVNFLSSRTDSIYITYIYDELGRISGQRRYGKMAWYPFIQYNYIEEELIAQELTFQNDSIPVLKTVIRYKENYLPLRKEEYKTDSILRRYWVYEYDSCMNLIKELYVNTPNGPGVSAFGNPFEPWPNDTTRYEIVYSEGCRQKTKREFSNSKLRKLTEFSTSGDTVIAKTIEYGINDKASTLHIEKSIDSVKIVKHRFLGSQGNPTHHSTYLNGQLSYYLSIDDGQIRKEKIYNNESLLDQHGNWISKKHFENDRLNRISKRKILYKKLPANNGEQQ